MKNHGIRRSFTTRIFATVLLVALVPLAITNYAMLPLLLDGVEAQRARQAQGRLQTAALRLGEMAGRLTARMNAVAESPALGEGAFSPAGEEALYQALFSLLEPVYEEGRFYLYSQDGGVYAVNGGAQAPEFTPDWGVFRAAAQQPGETIFLPADGTALCAVRTVGTGFLLAQVDAARLDALLLDCCGENENLLALNAQGRLTYALQPANAQPVAQALRRQLLAGETLAGMGDENNYHLLREETTGLFLILQQPRVFNAGVRETYSLVCAVMGLLCLLLCLWGGWVLSRHLSRPVRELSAAMEQAQQGNFSLRLPAGREDELGRLNDSFNRMMTEYQENLRRSVQHEKELNDARLRMMQAQLNPHFLYNTLDSLKWMGVAHNAPQVSALAADLASLLRASISGNEFVTLEEELELVERYIDIQSIRFADRFVCEIAVDEQYQGCMVPKLVLQPLVENAILHGVSDREDGYIKLWAEGDEKTVTLFVSDNGCGMPPEMVAAINRGDAREAGGHLGIYNVNSIIKLHFGAQYGISASSAPGRGSRVRVRLPNHKKP